MIERIKGEVVARGEGYVVVDVSGLGYRVEVNDPWCIGGDVLYTSLSLGSVNEIKAKLYGFETEKARDLFVLLKGVTGVGAVAAMRIATSRPTVEIVDAIREGSESVLRVKGVGAKTAKKIVEALESKIGALS